MDMPSAVIYFIPPLAGAVIGYITNKIAITMLFRPYREKRFFGFRLPLTPGIIPKQRHELARSIARQVSTELFTVEAVCAQMETPGFLQGLESAIRRGGDILCPVKISSILKNPANSPLRRFSGLWKELADSPGIHSLGTALLRGLVRTYLGSERTEVPEQGGRGPAGELTAGILHRHIQENRKIEELLSPEARQAIIAGFAGVLPSLRRFLIQWLNRSATRNELHRRGVLLFRDAVDSLSGIQRLVVVAGQYHRTMEENMSYLVDRFIQNLEESLQSPETVEGLLVAAEEYLKQNLKLPLGEFLEPDKIDELAGIMDKLFSGVDPFKAESGITAAGILSLVPEDLSVGDLIGWNTGGRELLVPLVRDTVVGLLVKAVPIALEVMDIEKLVILRIDSLAIEEVESLLLLVIKKQLKWINVFGAFLGAVLGGFQVFLMYLRG
ncbi:DUF445 family protein [Marispirochaeta sp.]|jgi:uncharacterized membrane protein YheB (UPF0754 family)|uniref:DUF445 family protein n=1 Tax=Marispirochaeta sp. TaxID=2038653 RepID=UPI0029C7AEB6|nr:DUF445 family protein [Marispirochaeta sp.]